MALSDQRTIAPLGNPEALTPPVLPGRFPGVPDLSHLLTLTEGKTLEFKRDLSSPDKVIRTIVAFANGAGGIVLIGVTDGSRHVVGVVDPTKVEEQLANLISDRIEPRLVPELRVVPWRRTYVVEVEVFPSSSRPHWVKAEGLAGGTYVRVGSTNRKADPAQVEELKRMVLGRSYDEEALPELNPEAIDFRAASELFAPMRTLKRVDLRSLQLTTLHQRREVPTVGGVLLFGVKRVEIFPQAFIRAGCFQGADKSQILDSAEIRSHPAQAVEEVLNFVKRNTRRAVEIHGAQNQEVWEFPLVAIREAVINALVHSDYSQRSSPIRIAVFADRIEIDNPGGLPPGLTIEEIHRGISKLRNRVIGRVFHELKLIEQWGSGVQRMTKTCLEAGLPEPKFEEIGSGFRVTFQLAAATSPKLDDINQRILNFIRQQPGVSTSQVATHIGRTPRATRDRLNHLVQLGSVVVMGTSPSDPRRVFHPAKK
jgi:ATP-dependent DNA helicase RecG